GCGQTLAASSLPQRYGDTLAVADLLEPVAGAEPVAPLTVRRPFGCRADVEVLPLLRVDLTSDDRSCGEGGEAVGEACLERGADGAEAGVGRAERPAAAAVGAE